MHAKQNRAIDLKPAGEITEIDLVVFDCDGVLLDTMGAKIQAFRDWVRAVHLDKQEAFIDLAMNGFGKSRTQHIRSFYVEILDQTPEPDFLEAEVARFTATCEPPSTWVRILSISRRRRTLRRLQFRRRSTTCVS
ncbi:MAG: hypothetical protein AAGC73_08540 [Verrucomicrobiota bacterium]